MPEGEEGRSWLFLRHLLLVDDERDVIARGHGQHLAFNADLQTFRGQQRTAVLFGALLFVEASLARVRYHLPVAETQRRTMKEKKNAKRP